MNIRGLIYHQNSLPFSFLLLITATVPILNPQTPTIQISILPRHHPFIVQSKHPHSIQTSHRPTIRPSLRSNIPHPKTSTQLFIHPSTQPFIPFSIQSITPPSNHPSIPKSLHPTIKAFLHLSPKYRSTQPSLNLFNHHNPRPIIHSLLHLHTLHPTTHTFLRPNTNPLLYPNIPHPPSFLRTTPLPIRP